jgi:Xaa-Pro dipeptidase
VTGDAVVHRLAAQYDAQAAGIRPELPFSEEEFGDRRRRLLAAMEAAGIDLLFVTSPEGMYYLHGYCARWYQAHSTTAWPPVAATVLDARSGGMIHFDRAEETRLLQLTSAADQIALYDSPDLESCLDFLTRELRAHRMIPARVGMEKWSYVPNHAVAERLEAALVGQGCSIEDGTGLIRGVRLVKSEQELRYIEEAGRIADAGLTAAGKALTVGISELELWAEMMRAMIGAGGEPAAMHELVNAQYRGVGHKLGSRHRIGRGEIVGLDPCGVVRRYHANVSATFCIGDPPAGAVHAMDIAAGAFPVLCDVARDGVPVRTVNAALREYYQDAGVWDLRAWVGGYELGASFAPDWVGEFVFSAEDENPEGVFRAGMVTNYESALKTGGMIDTLIYGTGPARALSALPKKLVVLAP